MVKGFGQECPVAFQKRDREKERASWNQGAQVLRHDLSDLRRDALRFPALRRLGSLLETPDMLNNPHYILWVSLFPFGSCRIMPGEMTIYAPRHKYLWESAGYQVFPWALPALASYGHLECLCTSGSHKHIFPRFGFYPSAP